MSLWSGCGSAERAGYLPTVTVEVQLAAPFSPRVQDTEHLIRIHSLPL